MNNEALREPLPAARRAQRALRKLATSTRPVVYGGNQLELLRNGAEYFPRLLAAINGATRSIYIETYIFELDNVGEKVSDALAAAAQRGVSVHLLIDGFGSQAAADLLVARLRPKGAKVIVFRRTRWWRIERRLLRRLHRKVSMFDDRLAFVGGINIIDDHHHPDPEPVRAGLGPRFDFAVACEGPLVAAIAFTVTRLWWTVSVLQLKRRPSSRPHHVDPPPPTHTGMRAALLLRDNLRNRRTIERAYLDAFAHAKREVLIANAYFLPGKKFREALCDLAKSGVQVRLLLQGRVEYLLQHYAQQALYGDLVKCGVQIYEYTPSYLHAKVAVVDGRWATVGSSNIDPYSLLLAREANVAVYDETFAGDLQRELEAAIAKDSAVVDADACARRSRLRRAMSWVAYQLVRVLTLVATRRDDG
ncbi:MAG TPA: cardiolipin synthase ClsB [Burkholderiaceae bacterium]|nr:cardiolipin synthase ClsB [Burkholderiaceae bacterium]